MTSTELDTLHLALPYCLENGTSIPALCRMLGWSDRKVRQGIQELRRERHIPVVALTKPNGVFIATKADLDALRRTRDSLRSRAMSELVTVREMDMAIADLAWSPTLFEATA